mmetsp:Transcript_42895/g.102266  ORF Transcript_42895/g.102266 Transcript_42895/m.102266 type:complete len:332 (+) Transcript_42895:121-1116(+)
MACGLKLPSHVGKNLKLARHSNSVLAEVESEQGGVLPHQADLAAEIPKVDFEFMRVECSDRRRSTVWAAGAEVREALAQNRNGLLHSRDCVVLQPFSLIGSSIVSILQGVDGVLRGIYSSLSRVDDNLGKSPSPVIPKSRLAIGRRPLRLSTFGCGGDVLFMMEDAFLSLTVVLEKHSLDDVLGFLQPRLRIFLLHLQQGPAVLRLVVANLGLEGIDLALLRVELLPIRYQLGLLHLSNRLELCDLHEKKLQVLGELAETLAGITRVLRHGVRHVVDLLHVLLQVVSNDLLHNLLDGRIRGVGHRDGRPRQLEGPGRGPTENPSQDRKGSE